MNNRLRKRVSGALYGLLVGDALGCPAEGMSEADIKERFGRLEDMQDTDPHYRPAGLHSDDGQQALCLIDAMVFGGKAPDKVFAKLLVEMLENGSKGYRRFGLHRGTGANFRRTVMALKQEQAFRDAANVTAGNGAAMRIAPVAIFHRDNKENLLESLLDVSMLTHLDVRGVAAAMAVASFVRQGLDVDSPQDIDIDELIEDVRVCERAMSKRLADDSNEAPDHRYSSVLEEALVMAHEESIDDRLNHIVALVAADADREVSALSGFAPASVTASIIFALRAESFEQGVIDTVNKGGDADTTAAMVGQMLGAVFGFDAIPSRWINNLWARAMIEDRIDALIVREENRAPFGFSITDLEAPWTQAVNDEVERRRRLPNAPALETHDRHESPAPRNDLALENAIKQKSERAQNKASSNEPKKRPKKNKNENPPQLGLFATAIAPAVDAENNLFDTASNSPSTTPSESLEREQVEREQVEQGEQVELGQVEQVEAVDEQIEPVELGGAEREVAQVEQPQPVANGQNDATPSDPSPPDFANHEGGVLVFEKGDITKAQVEVIVNAANSSLRGGGGVDGAIHAAGGPLILQECEAIRSRQGGCRTGDAVMTGGGKLSAQYVIHAVGPRWRGGKQNEELLLEKAYRSSFEIAHAAGLKSIALPSIATGSYRFPLERAAQIAVGTARSYIKKYPNAFNKVIFMLYSDDDLKAYQHAKTP